MKQVLRWIWWGFLLALTTTNAYLVQPDYPANLAAALLLAFAAGTWLIHILYR